MIERLFRFAKLLRVGLRVRGPKGRRYAARLAWYASRRHCYPYDFFASLLAEPPSHWDVIDCGCGVCGAQYAIALRRALERGYRPASSDA